MRSQLENSSSHAMGHILKSAPFIPSVTLKTENSWQTIGKYAEKAALTSVEILLRSPYAESGLRALKKEFPNLKVGMGTVLSSDEWSRAEDAGADFIVSPGMTPELLNRAEESGLAYLPGVMTPAEIQVLSARGFWNGKLFPAGYLGEAYLKTLEGPFAHMRFCVAGAISEDSWNFFAQCKLVRSISGTWVMPDGELGEEQLQMWLTKIESRLYQFLKIQNLIS